MSFVIVVVCEDDVPETEVDEFATRIEDEDGVRQALIFDESEVKW